MLNTKSLCVLPGRQCWCLYIDTLILQMGGNLADVVVLAIRAALENTKLPKTIVVEEGELIIKLVFHQSIYVKTGCF